MVLCDHRWMVKKASAVIAAALPKPKKAKKKAGGPRKLGLLHGPRYVAIEDVTPRHKKECRSCGEPPKDRRLFVRLGSGRHAKIEVYCVDCGVEWLHRGEREYSRARTFLAHGELPGDDSNNIRLA